MVTRNIFSVTKYAELILAYSVSQQPQKEMIVLHNILIKSWMIGKRSIRIHNMAWFYVTT